MKKSLYLVLIATLVLSLSGISQAAAPVSKTGVYYEIFVRSFYDSNNDGIGDLRGVTKKLDYIQSLGVKGIWLMPITNSPSYHGYDTTNYYNINPDYGTIADLQALVKAAHKRHIKVIMDLVVNHTSSQHPWFVDAVSNPSSKYRNYYIFAKDGQDTSDQSAAGSGDAWHDSAGGKFVGTFWSGMPDLNFDNPAVRSEMIKAGQFWLKKGVDGFRLDAAKHIYEDFSGDSYYKDTANAKSAAWWKQFRTGMNAVNKNTYLVGEIWDSPVVVGKYIKGALNAGFNFDLAKQIISAASGESDGGIAFYISNITRYYKNQLGISNYVDAPFLTNHDQNRIMSQLEGNMNHAKMAASLLLTLPGNPFLYYGEEIGMKGVKPDEALRTPMIWNANGATGQTNAMDGYTDQPSSVSVSAQTGKSTSLLEHYKKIVKLRNSDYTLSDGAIGEYDTGVDGIASWTRSGGGIHTLVVHNLTGKSKVITINKADISPLKFSKIKFSSKTGSKYSKNKLTIPAYSTIIMKK